MNRRKRGLPLKNIVWTQHHSEAKTRAKKAENKGCRLASTMITKRKLPTRQKHVESARTKQPHLAVQMMESTVPTSQETKISHFTNVIRQSDRERGRGRQARQSYESRTSCSLPCGCSHMEAGLEGEQQDLNRCPYGIPAWQAMAWLSRLWCLPMLKCIN